MKKVGAVVGGRGDPIMKGKRTAEVHASSDLGGGGCLIERKKERGELEKDSETSRHCGHLNSRGRKSPSKTNSLSRGKRVPERKKKTRRKNVTERNSGKLGVR